MSAQAARRGGKRHARACRANDSRLAAFVDALDSSTDRVALEAYMTSTASQLARVLKNHGGRQLEVQLQDGTTIKARVSGTLGTRGRAANKAHVEYVMSAGDVILISGGIAAAKVPRGLYARLEAHYSRLRVGLPKGFFLIGTEAEEEEDDIGWAWDTSRETAVAEAALSKARTPAGGAGDAGDDSDDDIDVDAV